MPDEKWHRRIGHRPSPANRTISRRRQRVFNLGLPRTGTTWFTAVTAHLGLQSLHCNEPAGCHGLARATLVDAFGRAATQPTALAHLVRAFDAFSDVPWYGVTGSLLGRLAPRGAEVFLTTRGVDAWFASLQHALLDEAPHANCSVDPLLRYAAESLGVAQVCGANGKLSRRPRDWQRLFYEHHARVLRAFPSVTVLDLSSRAAAEASARLLAQRVQRRGAPPGEYMDIPPALYTRMHTTRQSHRATPQQSIRHSPCVHVRVAAKVCSRQARRRSTARRRDGSRCRGTRGSSSTGASSAAWTGAGPGTTFAEHPSTAWASDFFKSVTSSSSRRAWLRLCIGITSRKTLYTSISP